MVSRVTNTEGREGLNKIGEVKDAIKRKTKEAGNGVRAEDLAEGETGKVESLGRIKNVITEDRG